jgi:hypothetical protein
MLLSNGDKMLLLSCTSLLRSVLGEKIMKINILIIVFLQVILPKLGDIMELYVEHFCYTNIAF